MPATTVTSKGRITIPAAVRASLGIEGRIRVEFVEVEKGKFAIVPATHSVQAFKGLLRKPVIPVSVEDMNAAISTNAALVK